MTRPSLTPEEARVLGSLVEKEATVPGSYPMTLNGLRAACNQSSNRDPVVAYDDGVVERALSSAKGKGLCRVIHASHGARTAKYRHVLDEALSLERPDLAVLSVLLLRGPQTAAELRARTERHHAFDSVADVESVLSALAAGDEPLVALLAREPGRREPRWAELLTTPGAYADPAPDTGGGVEAGGAAVGAGGADTSDAGAAGVGVGPTGAGAPGDPGFDGHGPVPAHGSGGLEELRAELAGLRRSHQALSERFEELLRRLGEDEL